jgi:hypothetical protein
MSEDLSKYYDPSNPIGQINRLFNNNNERKIIVKYIEQLRRWGKYNTITTDLSPFLLDGRSTLESELTSEIMDYLKETQKFPVDMDDFIETQPEEIQYIWNNSQTVRDLMVTLTLRFLENNDLDADIDEVNKHFIKLGRQVYKIILTSPFFTGLR